MRRVLKYFGMRNAECGIWLGNHKLQLDKFFMTPRTTVNSERTTVNGER